MAVSAKAGRVGRTKTDRRTGITNSIVIRTNVSPDKIQEHIEAALRRAAELDARAITVETQGSKVVLRGTVRQDDVTSANTVFSYNVADATIQIIGKGTVTDTQRKGWFTHIWDKLTPF